MFGGYVPGIGFVSDTWQYDGVDWTEITPAHSPGDRHSHAMAYDSDRDQMVMFAGYSGLYYNDTWEYNGTSWSQLLPLNRPGLRSGHTMAYDSARGRVVMFGAWPSLSNATWEYAIAPGHGTMWTQVTTTNSPLGRHGSAMVYDSARARVVMFGGSGAGGFLDDTWELGLPGPAGSSAAMTYGVGCGDPALTLTPVALAPPVLGSTAQVVLSEIPSSLAFMALGWSDSTFGSFSLPLDLGSYGMPGCDLLQSTEHAAIAVTWTTPTTATYSLPLPNWSSLIGVRLYLQGWANAPGANTASVIVSNGVAWVIGNM